MSSCRHCKAKKFFHETNNFCCADGSISLATNAVPEQLYRLFVSNDPKSIQFRTYVRTYNNKFAFKSFGVKFDRNLSQRNRGIYTFRVQGQIYHYLSDLIPSNGRPSNLQLYFYDIEHEFKNLYNALTSSEVAAIWVEDDTLEQVTPRDIFVYKHVGESHIVQYYFGCYDPLQYPLLFPFGDIGWHQGIQRINRRGASISNHTHAAQSIDPHQSISAEELLKREEQVLRRNRKDPFVSCREYYCYKL
ncbi:hypothetical protein CIPAW_09G109800 [Carya illinoinensis]|uniref:Helitron helicase-like domain-containing protein n=1 Tax=Carya illinoinensis TaxID=32201 RepID=A0A8T1PBC9_CARIL|nr:hypothetical protein CIPAW_09G109800 [Carya illinoinensis]